MKAPGISERIKQQAVELIKAHPDGLRYSELFRKLRDNAVYPETLYVLGTNRAALRWSRLPIRTSRASNTWN